MKRNYILIIGLVLLIGCSSSKNAKYTPVQEQELEALLKTKSFEFIANWARPLPTSAYNRVVTSGFLIPGSTANNIDLTGNNNYFRMVGDSVYAYFPYYGERQFSGNFPGTDGAIQFQGVPEDLVMEQNKKGYRFSFTINGNSETFQINGQWFPSKKGNININSTHRFPIAYSGQVEELYKTE